MFRATLGGKIVLASFDEPLPRHAPPEAFNANSLYVPSGEDPAHGWLFMRRSDLDALNLNDVFSLVFELEDERTGLTTTRTWNGLIICREPVNLSPTLTANNPLSRYLVEVSDARWRVQNPYFCVSLAKMYNVSSNANNGAAGPTYFLRESVGWGSITGATNASPIVVNSAVHGLVTGNVVIITGVEGNTATNGEFTITRVDANNFSLDGSTGSGVFSGTDGEWQLPWTWDSMLSDIWGSMTSQLGSYPTLPVTPASRPIGWVFSGVSAWGALNQILRKIGCTVRTDLMQAVGSQFSFVQVGADDAALTATLNAAGELNLKIHDSEFLPVVRAKIPGSVRVLFHKQLLVPTKIPPWLKGANPYAVDVVGPEVLGAEAVYHPIWDDMPALYDDVGALTNSAALDARALEVSADYYRKLRQDGGTRLWKRYNGLLVLAPGATLKSVSWRCGSTGEQFGSGVYTEIVRHPFVDDTEPGKMTDYQDAGTVGDLVRLGFPWSPSEIAGPQLRLTTGILVNGIFYANLLDIDPATDVRTLSDGICAIDLCNAPSIPISPDTSDYLCHFVGTGPTGQFYLSLAGSNLGNPLSDLTKWVPLVGNPSSVLPAWAAGTYTLGQLVSHSGSNYACVVAFTTTTPGASADWLLIDGAVFDDGYGSGTTYAALDYVQAIMDVYDFNSDVDESVSPPDNGDCCTPTACPESLTFVGFRRLYFHPQNGYQGYLENIYSNAIWTGTQTWVNDGSKGSVALFELTGIHGFSQTLGVMSGGAGGGGGGAYSASVLPLILGTYTFEVVGGNLTIKDPTNAVILKAESGASTVVGVAGTTTTSASGPGALGGTSANSIGQLLYDGGRGGNSSGLANTLGPDGSNATAGGPGAQGQDTPPVNAALGGGPNGSEAYGVDVFTDSNGVLYGKAGLGKSGGAPSFATGDGMVKISFGSCAVLPIPMNTPPAQPAGAGSGSTSMMVWSNSTIATGTLTQEDGENYISVTRSAGPPVTYTLLSALTFVSARSYQPIYSATPGSPGDAPEVVDGTRTATGYAIRMASGNDAKEVSIGMVGHLLNGTGGALLSPVTLNVNASPLAIDAPTLEITGSGFDLTPGNNTIILSLGAVGTISAVTSVNQATITFSTPPSGAGNLTGILTNGAGSSAPAQIIATVVAAPVVTLTTTNVGTVQTIVTVTGSFFALVANQNSVTFSGALAGTFAALTVDPYGTTLTVDVSTGLPMSAGSLDAVVACNGSDSGAPVQVATVVTSPTLTVATTSIPLSTISLTLAGTGEDGGTPGNNVVTFSGAATNIATASASTGTSATVSVTLTDVGPLYASIAVSGVSSGAPVQVRTATAPPVITVNTANVLYSSTTLIITGTYFSAVPANNSVYLYANDGTILAYCAAGGGNYNLSVATATTTTLTLNVPIGFPVAKVGQTIRALVGTPGGWSSAVSPVSGMAIVGTLSASGPGPGSIWTMEHGSINGVSSGSVTIGAANTGVTPNTGGFYGSVAGPLNYNGAVAYKDNGTPATSMSATFTFALADSVYGNVGVGLRWDTVAQEGFLAFIDMTGPSIHLIEYKGGGWAYFAGNSTPVTLTDGNSYTITITDDGVGGVEASIVDDSGTQTVGPFGTTDLDTNTQVAAGWIQDDNIGVPYAFSTVITALVIT